MTTHVASDQKNESPAGLAPCEISADQLARLCDPNTLTFTTTNELPTLQEVIGQPRAFRALELGSEVGGIGYNIFVLGIPDSGRTTLTRSYLQRKAALTPLPDDWCYVNNFDDRRKPYALRLPAGTAVELRKEMQQLIADCKLNIARVFSSEEYTKERDRLVNAMNEKQAHEFSQLEEYVHKYNFVIIKTPYGFFLGPMIEGKPLSQDSFEKLTDDQKEKFHKLQEKLSAKMEKTLASMREVEQAANKNLEDLNLRTALFIIRPLVDRRKDKYSGCQAVQTYLDQIQSDLVKNVNRFHPDVKTEQNILEEKEWAVRYEINVLVDQSGRSGAPVIVENQPTYHNLLGSIEHDMILGASYTDFSKIRPGALHRANGGFLILPARDVLLNPYAWEGLKRVLRDGELRILELGNQMGLASATTLDPEPIPLNVKVILVGTPTLYYLLRAYDEDFDKLFKVRAEFATEMKRSPESESEYALFVKSVIDENKLLPFDRSAVARIIEHGARMVEKQDKLSTQFGIIADLIRESAYWARKDSLEYADATAVQKALDERIFRSNLIEERIQEMIQNDQLIVAVEGQAVGQINALSVSSLGDYFFGRPNRVTASASVGQGGIIDIERQARLGGPIHTKGVLIISGFLGEYYGKDRPLNLTASLTFEQSYDEIEGDSASAAELIALLSSISAIPIDQSRAITGSINQHGQIQAIGGVNEKVEGFFETCKKKGLTGRQGVIIPQSNRSNLMLTKEVRDSAAQGAFHIWAVETIGEAISLLTGYEFGEPKEDGTFPKGTFNQAVIGRLDAFNKAADRVTLAKRKHSDHNPSLSKAR